MAEARLKHGAWVVRVGLVDSGKILLCFYEEKNTFFLGFLVFENNSQLNPGEKFLYLKLLFFFPVKL